MNEAQQLYYRKNLTGYMTTTGPPKCRGINVLTRKLLTTLSLGSNKVTVIISKLGQGSLRDHNGIFELSGNMYGGE